MTNKQTRRWPAAAMAVTLCCCFDVAIAAPDEELPGKSLRRSSRWDWAEREASAEEAA
jgi:hypothetical protein